MPVTANVWCTKLVVGSLATPAVGKRRRLGWDERRGTGCLKKEAVPQLSSRASDNENDAEVIQRACEGDPTAFERLYRSHCKRVYAVCRMVGNTTEAEDLAQEAFLLLFRKIHTFRGESAFSTWLRRLVVNTVLMHLRKKALPVVSMETGPAPTGEATPPSVEIAASDLLLEGRLIESISAAASRNCRRALAQYLSCTISRGTNIARSRRCWDAR
jgi:RNA polymerase sigma factor (sigma-70 family)